jgi:hypothetical protein
VCIAIYKPAGKIIPEVYLKTAFANNPHGAGFLVANGSLTLHKGFFTYKDFYKEYHQYRKEQCLVHFRISTGGKIDKENCHPFLVTEELGFIHNGNFTINKNDACKSGIWHFNEFYLKPFLLFCDDEWQDFKFRRFFASHAPICIAKSRFIFLDAEGNFSIINEHHGSWESGIWYSNSSHRDYPKFVNNIKS